MYFSCLRKWDTVELDRHFVPTLCFVNPRNQCAFLTLKACDTALLHVQDDETETAAERQSASGISTVAKMSQSKVSIK